MGRKNKSIDTGDYKWRRTKKNRNNDSVFNFTEITLKNLQKRSLYYGDKVLRKANMPDWTIVLNLEFLRNGIDFE